MEHHDRPSIDAIDIPPDLLAIDEAEMRRLGYWVVDRVIEHIQNLNAQPAITAGEFKDLSAALGGPVPRAASAIEPNLSALADIALANQQHGDHPRYFARVPGPSSFPAILGEWLATGLQSVASSWGGGSGPSTLEVITLDWLSSAMGLAAGCEGVLLSGGSMANVTAVITARNQQTAAGRYGVIYLSDQAHSSIKRGIISVGHPEELITVLASDHGFRLPPKELRRVIENDLAIGRQPMMVIATAGTTNTGAVDALAEIADLCEQWALWFHIDGAYGGPAALSLRGRAAMAGIDRADSFVMDPHKWLFQPYDIACLFVRPTRALEQTFSMHPEYLADVAGGEVDMANRSLELTRRSRAVKLWLTIRAYGFDTLSLAIERGINLAEHAQYCMEQDPSLEVVTPAQLGIVTFAGVGRTDEDHRRAAATLVESGFAAASTTVLKGRTVLRLCTINPRTTSEDISATIARLAGYLVT